jgi:hypothetical protein
MNVHKGITKELRVRKTAADETFRAAFLLHVVFITPERRRNSFTDTFTNDEQLFY